MRKFVIVTHGAFAEGIQQTLTLFLGENHPFAAISAYLPNSDRDLAEDIAAFMETVKEEDELIILSDIMGGSVNQRMLPWINRDKTFIISGINLPLLIQLSCMDTSKELTIEDMRELVAMSKETIVVVNDELIKTHMSIEDE